MAAIESEKEELRAQRERDKHEAELAKTHWEGEQKVVMEKSKVSAFYGEVFCAETRAPLSINLNR